MTDFPNLRAWVRRFVLEQLIHQRNLSRGTQRSYRDTLALPFMNSGWLLRDGNPPSMSS